MEEYHGIIVDVSQKDKSIFNKLKILGSKISSNDDWTLYKIEVNSENVDETIKKLQDNLDDGFYFHLYRNDELIVVFKERIFNIKPDKSTWNEAIDYGKSLDIPERQLDFYPCKVEDETY